MNVFLKSCLILLIGSVGSQVNGQTILKPTIKSPTSFAIVVDAKTYSQAQNEIEAYRSALEKDGLGTYILAHNWAKPEDIKAELLKIYQSNQPLEGTVLIGDIPIVMVRDAQYLTSAFKMNQKIRWDKSSVPSDRYYDDFDLKFNFLKQDTAAGRKQYFYYSLDANSPQYIQMDIYSGRIKPPVKTGEDPIEKVKAYLQKVVADKSKKTTINDMIVSTGHGYSSNAVNALSGEVMALKSQFPSLYKPGNSIKFLNFRNAEFMKFNLLNELKREGLDFAYMTGHGTTTLQLLNGYPYVSSPQLSMENVGRYLRSKLRAAKEDGRDLEQVKDGFKKSLGVSDKWMLDAFDTARIDADSVYNDNLDIQMSDIKDAHIQAKLVYLNSCLTGSYHLPEYIAGYYPFSKNETIVAVASSVGILQDLWPAELMGTLQHAVSVGNWIKHIAYLETHILGDPTFHFEAKTANDINKHISLNDQSASYWKSLLKLNDADLQALALVHLSQILKEEEASKLFKSYYFNSDFETTRMQAFAMLRRYENADYYEVLHAAKSDAYEFIRRRAIYDLGDFGADDFVKDIVSFYTIDPHSERIAYRVRWSLPFFNHDVVQAEINKQILNNPNYLNAKVIADELTKSLNNAAKRVTEMQKVMLDKNDTDKNRLNEVKTLRLYRYHQLVPSVLALIADSENSDELRIASLEALSWFSLSFQRELIYKACESELAKAANSADLKYQAQKTLNVMRAHRLK